MIWLIFGLLLALLVSAYLLGRGPKKADPQYIASLERWLSLDQQGGFGSADTDTPLHERPGLAVGATIDGTVFDPVPVSLIPATDGTWTNKGRLAWKVFGPVYSTHFALLDGGDLVWPFEAAFPPRSLIYPGEITLELSLTVGSGSVSI